MLITRPPGYELRVAEGDVDVHTFEAAVDEGRTALGAGRPRDARRILQEALALWRGPPFADLTFEDCLQADIARLEELRINALEARIEADLALGRSRRRDPRAGERSPRRIRRAKAFARSSCSPSTAPGDRPRRWRSTATPGASLVDELAIEPGRALQRAGVAASWPRTRVWSWRRRRHRTRRTRCSAASASCSSFAPSWIGPSAGAGALLLVGGEPGIGKSRLAEALAAQARDSGARVLVGRCWEAGGAPAYWPWVQALRGYLRGLPRAQLIAQTGAGGAELTALFPELGDALPASAAASSEGARFRLFEAIGSLLANASAAKPLAIFLDDVHAADGSSLLLLRYLATQLPGLPLLISCCYRDTEAGPELEGALADLGRDPVTHRVSLAGFDQEATAHLLEETMGSAPEAELLAQVQDGTRGNPLFVAELGRLLAAGEWHEGRLPIPDGVRETIGHRLERRSSGCRKVLDTASAFGREFELEPLGRVCGLEEDALFAAIEEATAARFVGDVPGAAGRLRFSHVLMRDALYDQLAATRRMKLHREIADGARGPLRGQPRPARQRAGTSLPAGREHCHRAGDRVCGARRRPRCVPARA